MDELIAFLNARLDELEAAAKAWLPFGNPAPAQREHIARYDLGRALREVATWRAIIAQAVAGPPVDDPDRRGGFNTALGFVLQLKAAEYSDHPDWCLDGCWGRRERGCDG